MMAYTVQSMEGDTGDKIAVATIADAWVAQQIAVKPAPLSRSSSSGRTGTADESTSVTEEVPLFEDEQSDVHAYPNPVQDYVTIQVDGMTQQPSNGDVSVLDRVGRAYPVKSDWDGQNNKLAIDFTPMGTGIYFIKVNTSTGSKFVRVIKVSE